MKGTLLSRNSRAQTLLRASLLGPAGRAPHLNISSKALIACSSLCRRYTANGLLANILKLWKLGRCRLWKNVDYDDSEMNNAIWNSLGVWRGFLCAGRANNSKRRSSTKTSPGGGGGGRSSSTSHSSGQSVGLLSATALRSLGWRRRLLFAERK